MAKIQIPSKRKDWVSVFPHFYFLRRPRTTSSAPQSSAIALPAELGSISGTGTAIASPDTPINSNIIPTVLVIF
jgi:hypothetical protein